MIRVLLVDDSPLVRNIVLDILEKDPEIIVTATAQTAEIALKKIVAADPDVITMGIEMPGMSGLSAIQKIMRTRPTPVIVLSAFAKYGAELTLQALENGAVDFIEKPSSSLSGYVNNIARDLVKKVKQASRINLEKLKLRDDQGNFTVEEDGIDETEIQQKFDLIAIGTSTGGPVALKNLLSCLPENFPVGIVVVQHMPPVFTDTFAHRLDSLCRIYVKEALDGDLVIPGRVLIAPGDCHMTLSRYRNRPKVTLHKWEPVGGHRPSVDVLMYSVARQFGSRALGIIMTGMGRDGAAGVAELKKCGGYVIAQDQDTSVIYEMNREVISNGHADEVVSLSDMADRIMTRLRGGQESGAARFSAFYQISNVKE
jgi:two-component system chemotaxis response regulator CheB